MNRWVPVKRWRDGSGIRVRSTEYKAPGMLSRDSFLGYSVLGTLYSLFLRATPLSGSSHYLHAATHRSPLTTHSFLTPRAAGRSIRLPAAQRPLFETPAYRIVGRLAKHLHSLGCIGDL
jgi:hypothetical protein